MSDNSFGKGIIMVPFGESHGPAVGVLIEGLPPGLKISEEKINKWLELRRPGVSRLSTQRKEEDNVEIISGVYRGFTTGAPLVALVKNEGSVDSFYGFIEEGWVRPGHADYPAYIKYKGYNDPRGGGRFSARITVGYVIAGAIASQLVRNLGIEVIAYTRRIGEVECPELTLEEARPRYLFETRCPLKEYDDFMMKEIEDARKAGDTVGGIIEVTTNELPVGLGQPVFSSLDSELSKGYFSIPAVKGVEFGKGFSASKMRGSQHNDQYAIINGKVKPLTNNAGGVLGGMSFGASLRARIAFKPISSIYRPQITVNIKEMKEGLINIKGMHDACPVPRAVPIVEAITYFVLADMAVRGGFL